MRTSSYLSTNSNQATAPQLFSQAAPAQTLTSSPSSRADGMAIVGPRLVALEYIKSSPVVVEGMITHCSYEFSLARPVQMVDSRDIAWLLATGYFRRKLDD